MSPVVAWLVTVVAVLALILIIDALNRAAVALSSIAGSLAREEKRREEYEAELRAMTGSARGGKVAPISGRPTPPDTGYPR